MQGLETGGGGGGGVMRMCTVATMQGLETGGGGGGVHAHVHSSNHAPFGTPAHRCNESGL